MQEGERLLQDDFARARDALGRRFAQSGDWRLFRAGRALDALETYLRRPLRMAIIGEQSSGKSSLINMLLRASVVPAGALAGVRANLLLRYGPETALFVISTDGIRARLTSKALAKLAGPEAQGRMSGTTIIYNASEASSAVRRDAGDRFHVLTDGLRPPADGSAKLIEIRAPHAFLRSAELVESRLYPQDMTRNVLRHVLPVDLAIWCTLGTQAWKETERKSWERLPAKLRANAILLVSYKDAIGSPKDEAKLLTRLERSAGPFFSEIVLVSLRRAADAIGQGAEIADEEKWQTSGAAALETAIGARIDALQEQRRAKGLAFLRRIAALAGNSSRLPSAASHEGEEMIKHFEGLIRHIEAGSEPGHADLAPRRPPGREGKSSSGHGQEKR